VDIGRFTAVDIRSLQPYDVGSMIRVGDQNDGGYVIPRELPDMEVLVSFGLGDNWSFERSLAKLKIVRDFYIFDHTVSGSVLFNRFTRRLFTSPFNFKAINYRLLVLARYLIEFKLLRWKHVKKQITREHSDLKRTNLVEVAEQLQQSTLALKIDIEGDEYVVIDQIISLSSRIPLLVIEFHETESMRASFREALEKLANEYKIVHAHCNNFTGLSSDGIPLTVELTFLHSDFVLTTQRVNSIPRRDFDSPSSPDRPDITLEFKS